MVCPSRFSFILYNPIRKTFTDRKKILSESGVSSNSIVLEVGAGNGFFTEVLAEYAKKVYVLELQAGMVRKLKKRVQRFGDKVEIICSDVATYNVTEEMFDVCLIYYSLHEVRNKINAAKNISKSVKMDGLLSIYEPTIEVTRAKMENTIAMFTDMGFTKEMEWNRLFTRFARLRKYRMI